VQEQKEKQRLEGNWRSRRKFSPALSEADHAARYAGGARILPSGADGERDYYDFLALSSDRLMLAVGDISGKGISAALLMATIHSAVRAYSFEGMPERLRWARREARN